MRALRVVRRGTGPKMRRERLVSSSHLSYTLLGCDRNVKTSLEKLDAKKAFRNVCAEIAVISRSTSAINLPQNLKVRSIWWTDHLNDVNAERITVKDT